MRSIVIILLAFVALAAAAILPPALATTPVLDATGSYAAGIPAGLYLNACDLAGKLNGDWSSCRLLNGANIDGLLVKVRDERVTGPTTQGLHVCFYGPGYTMLDCPPNESGQPGASFQQGPCAADPAWAWCAHAAPGATLYAVSSATGVGVQWHLVAG